MKPKQIKSLSKEGVKSREEYGKRENNKYQYKSSNFLDEKYSQEDVEWLEGPESEYVGNIIETVNVS